MENIDWTDRFKIDGIYQLFDCYKMYSHGYNKNMKLNQ